MRLLLLVLIALVALIQYPLWMGRGGWFAVWDSQEQVASQRSINDGLRARNAALAAEVEDLRSGTEAAEERARGELGMLKRAEVFVQILPPEGKPPESKPTEAKLTDAKPAGTIAKPTDKKPGSAGSKPTESKPTSAAAKSPAQPTAQPTAQPAVKPMVKPPAKPPAKPTPSTNLSTDSATTATQQTGTPVAR